MPADGIHPVYPALNERQRVLANNRIFQRGNGHSFRLRRRLIRNRTS